MVNSHAKRKTNKRRWYCWWIYNFRIANSLYMDVFCFRRKVFRWIHIDFNPRKRIFLVDRHRRFTIFFNDYYQHASFTFVLHYSVLKSQIGITFTPNNSTPYVFFKKKPFGSSRWSNSTGQLRMPKTEKGIWRVNRFLVKGWDGTIGCEIDKKTPSLVALRSVKRGGPIIIEVPKIKYLTLDIFKTSLKDVNNCFNDRER